jgi:hypothetical protein
MDGVTETGKYDSRRDTQEHQYAVQARIQEFRDHLKERARLHDRSKLESPEKEVFDRVTPQLAGLTYGSDEYKAALADMGPALDHHYAENSHHPEHYRDGINGMSLLDLVEMLCDWKAAGERHDDGGDIERSLRLNIDRFKIEPQLQSILENTIAEMEWDHAA